MSNTVTIQYGVTVEVTVDLDSKEITGVQLQTGTITYEPDAEAIDEHGAPVSVEVQERAHDIAEADATVWPAWDRA